MRLRQVEVDGLAREWEKDGEIGETNLTMASEADDGAQHKKERTDGSTNGCACLLACRLGPTRWREVA